MFFYFLDELIGHDVLTYLHLKDNRLLECAQEMMIADTISTAIYEQLLQHLVDKKVMIRLEQDH